MKRNPKAYTPETDGMIISLSLNKKTQHLESAINLEMSV